MRNRPAVKVLIPYLAGIVIADKLNLNTLFLWILSATIIASAFIAYKKRWLTFGSVMLSLLFLSFGSFRYEISITPPINLDKILYKQVKIRGTVIKTKNSSLIVKGDISTVSDPSITAKAKVSVNSRDDILPYSYGDVVEISGKLSSPGPARNPGAFDYQKYLQRNGIFAVININNASDVQRAGTGGISFLRWMQKFREKIEEIAYDITTGEEIEIILKGIVLGENGDMSPELYEAFRRTGTAHILVVSGVNFAILAAWVVLLFKWIKKSFTGIKISILESNWLAYLSVFPFIFIYACMVGPQFSVIRAFVFIVLFIIAVIIDRDTDLFNNLATAALCILIFSPGAFWDAGFQLSFGAVASMTYIIPYFELWFGRIRNEKWHRRAIYRAAQVIAVSIAAQAGSGMIIARTFHTFSLSGIIVNPIIAPFVALITPLGFVSCIVGLIFPPLARILGYITSFLIYLMKIIVVWFSSRSFSSIPVRGFSLLHIIVISAFIIFAVHLPGLLKERRKLIIAVFALVTLCIWSAAMLYNGSVLKITYLDVGEGDSIFLDTPGGKKILIDGGSCNRQNDYGKRVVSPFLQHEGIRSLDLMVSTHPDNDHAGGLTYIVDNYRVKKVLTGSYGYMSPTYNELIRRLKEKGIEYCDAQAGIVLDDGDTQVEVLNCPQAFPKLDESTLINNNSVVLKVTYKEASFLFTGDIQEEAEQRLISSGNLQSTVLKVPHHGSDRSSSWEFLKAVQPSIGIISAGYKNVFNHPAPKIIGRYRWLGIRTYRTDRNGAVTLITDGRRGWINTVR